MQPQSALVWSQASLETQTITASVLKNGERSVEDRQFIRPKGLSDNQWALDLAILNSLDIPVPKEKKGVASVERDDPPKGGVG